MTGRARSIGSSFVDARTRRSCEIALAGLYDAGAITSQQVVGGWV